MTNVTLRRGKFYKDGVPMPLEFGNKDQLRLIRIVEQLKTEGSLFNPMSDGGWSLRCVCGTKLYFKSFGEMPCPTCAIIYACLEEEESGIPYVKIKSL